MPSEGLLLFYGMKELQEVSPQTLIGYATDMRTLKVRHIQSKQSILTRVMTYDMRTYRHIERYLYFKLNQ